MSSQVPDTVTVLWCNTNEVRAQNPFDSEALSCLRKQNINVTKTEGTEGPRLDLLLRAILGRPEYGNYKDTEDYRSLVRATMRRTGLDKSRVEEEFRTGLEKNDLTSVVGLFLLLCPKVTRLTLGLDMLINSRILDFVYQECVFRELSDCVSRFQHLTHIKLGASIETNVSGLVTWPRLYLSSAEQILNQLSYLALFSLPNLRHADIPIPFLRDTHWTQTT
ncbi:hypothetical protein DM02DRAFT_630235 [Periconia macrospinosa]|uniref:Uncharacterized protein n=1 Tax=Periconia macrospinosa TaxID=97972 RepID=A0A2V1DJR1_9PLEO|nr:hypothetical protein DM02DRAFT_630235 [Periconia macrospinosa]